MSGTPRHDSSAPRSETRREFLKAAGTVALMAPPALTMTMAATNKPAQEGYRDKSNSTSKNGGFYFLKWLLG